MTRVTNNLPSDLENQRMQINRMELVERIARIVPTDGHAEPLPGIHLYRAASPLNPIHSVVKPSFCVIAQGSKEVLLGASRYQYDATRYLITTLEMPRVSQVLEASPERPYLSFLLELTPALISAVMVEMGFTPAPRQSDGDANRARAINVSLLDVNLQDAVVRILRLLDSPAEAPVLLPLVVREIISRLLLGEQGNRLCHLAVLGGYTPMIVRAVERLREDYDQPLRIEELARDLGMSASWLHHQFKAVTAMSPLQFQKQLRLHEARRLMLSEDCDAASAAYRVGYNDASQFNREYKSLFGVPPIRDVQRLRGAVMEIAA
jgi:AraC-like DNA-binding protein